MPGGVFIKVRCCSDLFKPDREEAVMFQITPPSVGSEVNETSDEKRNLLLSIISSPKSYSAAFFSSTLRAEDGERKYQKMMSF